MGFELQEAGLSTWYTPTQNKKWTRQSFDSTDRRAKKLPGALIASIMWENTSLAGRKVPELKKLLVVCFSFTLSFSILIPDNLKLFCSARSFVKITLDIDPVTYCKILLNHLKTLNKQNPGSALQLHMFEAWWYTWKERNICIESKVTLRLVRNCIRVPWAQIWVSPADSLWGARSRSNGAGHQLVVWYHRLPEDKTQSGIMNYYWSVFQGKYWQGYAIH